MMRKYLNWCTPFSDAKECYVTAGICWETHIFVYCYHYQLGDGDSCMSLLEYAEAANMAGLIELVKMKLKSPAEEQSSQQQEE